MADFSIIQHIADDIKTITIQGATNIAKAACDVMQNELKRQNFNSHEEMLDFVSKASQILIKARETEPLLRNGMKYAKSKITQWVSQYEIADAFGEYLGRIQREEASRPMIWAELIQDNDQIVTHCHSSSVVKVLTTARDSGKKIHVYNTETRPLYQGRKTSMDLFKAGVPDTMITDDMAPFFVDNIYEKDIDIHRVFLWSDCIRPNGDTFNKVGSFAISLSAHGSNVPLYIVGSLLKIDMTKTIGIETRSGSELWPEAPVGLDILNYAFDMVPAQNITGIITEFGVIKPENLKAEVQKHYPRMLD
jgi:eIF-2B alpha/beta/delta-like uncharacterized protein